MSKSAYKKLPPWLKITKGKQAGIRHLSKTLEKNVPNSICQEARCPNRYDCFQKGILTFMILGTTCTRNCAFCSVAHGKPLPPDRSESKKIINAIKILKIKFAVLTSPNRDDLPDGGADHYAYIINEIKKNHPHTKVEVLIPDFQGNFNDLKTVLNANPDVLNHNMETVPSLYRVARRGSLFTRSLSILKESKAISPNTKTKSGLMVGLGESTEELLTTFETIAKAKVDILTIGQYLKPDKNNLEVEKYYTPNEFEKLKKNAEKMGFKYVFSGPLVRSSYLAEHVFNESLPSTVN